MPTPPRGCAEIVKRCFSERGYSELPQIQGRTAFQCRGCVFDSCERTKIPYATGQRSPHATTTEPVPSEPKSHNERSLCVAIKTQGGWHLGKKKKRKKRVPLCGSLGNTSRKMSCLLGCRSLEMLRTSRAGGGGRCQSSLLWEPIVHQHLCYRNAERTGPVGSPECGVKRVWGVAATASPRGSSECGFVITAWGLVSNCLLGDHKAGGSVRHHGESGPLSTGRVTVLHNFEGAEWCLRS